MAKSKDPEVVDEMRATDQNADADGPSGASETDDAAQRARSRASARALAAARAGPAQDAAADGGMDQPKDVAGDGAAAERAGETLAPDFAEAADQTGVHDDPQFREAAEGNADDHHEDHGHRSLAATALMFLVGAIAVASSTLWLAPRVAPHVPASIGQYLVPGQVRTATEIEALRQQLAEQSAQTGAQVAQLQAGLDAAAARLAALPDPEAAAANAAEALDLAREAGAQAAAVRTRSDAVAAELAGLRESIGAVNAALTGADGTAVPTELGAAVAGINARIENLSQTAAARSDLEALSARIAALEASAAAASAAQSQALGEVSTAIRQASLRSAVAALTSHVEGGQPYAAPLGEIAALTGSAAPAALAEAAATGLATPAALGARFGPLAQAAISADVRARAGEGASSQVLGWLRAQVTGRPVSEQPGGDVAATTSRIAARIREGALAEALAEADTLPPPAQAALGPWLERLRQRVEAGAALSAWLAEIGANG